mgnify:CR=1 FL=1
MSATPLVELVDIHKAFGAVQALSGASLSVMPGEVIGLVGDNAAGKSTFMKLLAGFYRPASGELLLDGEPVSDDASYERYRSLITAIFPDFHLFQRLYGLGEPDPAELNRMLTQFKLQDKTGLSHGEFRTVDLSSGQRRRLALVVAQLEQRPLLLLDDVFSELDPERRSHLVRRIAELPQSFVTTTTLDDLDPLLRGPVERGAGPVGEDEQRAFEPALADSEAVFEVAMVVLIRLGMHDHGVVHARAVHELQEELRCRGLLRLISAARMVGETRVRLAREAVRVGVHDRRALWLGGGQRRKRGGAGSGDAEKLPPVHGRANL